MSSILAHTRREPGADVPRNSPKDFIGGLSSSELARYIGGVRPLVEDEAPGPASFDRVRSTGAIGEEKLGTRLDLLISESIAVLHDRRIPGTKANIDHIVITQAGIWVIDAKRYKGRPELKVEGWLLRPRVEKVLVARRDCTKLVDGVLKQVELVRDGVGDVPVTGALDRDSTCGQLPATYSRP